MMAKPILNSDSLPKAGRVNEVCREWLVHEDGALAYRLQDKEIKEHYSGNKVRNAQVREDLPRAKIEQQLEELKYHSLIQQQEEKDAFIAREVALKLEREERIRERELEEKMKYQLKLDDERIQMEVELLMQRRLQEEKDQEIAKMIQEEENSADLNASLIDDQFLRDRKLAMEAQDAEFARLLQEKEKMKARRARERARQKKLNRQQTQELECQIDDVKSQIPNGLDLMIDNEKKSPQGSSDFTHHPFQCLTPEGIQVLRNQKEDVQECSNVAAIIDPTYYKNNNPSSSSSSSNIMSPSYLSPTFSHELENDNIPCYMPIQGQRRMQIPSSPLFHEEKNKRRVKDGCKNQ
ncbi:coiled-coil domain-containing protein 50 isoform X2 [Microplitis demolitor]|nr:coiled-coil domain-containing protein 50 isoform X2 [Microplitis demolitor]XP_014295570.1 coiled-coil domain-containing protein 50 isoform X2 [Microplitis demolitor]